jgi:hypothetical protein
MENGSGGFMGGMYLTKISHLKPCSATLLDLVFNGGKYGMSVGNQQFTVRNVTVKNANTAVNAIWNWGQQSFHLYGISIPEHCLSTGWTFQGISIIQCQVGFDLKTGGITSAKQVPFDYPSDFFVTG